MGLLRVTKFRNYQVSMRKLNKTYSCGLNLQFFLVLNVSIITVDSNVAILLMYYQHRLDLQLFLRTGTGSKEKIFEIQTTILVLML